MSAPALKKTRCSALALAICFVVTPVLAATVATKNPAKKKPKTLHFSEIQQIVQRHFAVIPDYQPGDLITQQAVQGAFKQLELYGWIVADQKLILGQVLGDGDFVARELRSKQGRQFMRQIKRYPGGFDRLDRIVAMPQGRNNVAQMVKLPDGYKIIEAMTTTQRGKKLGERLSKARTGKNFNKPTGKIYTVDALITRLKLSFENRKKK